MLALRRIAARNASQVASRLATPLMAVHAPRMALKPTAAMQPLRFYSDGPPPLTKEFVEERIVELLKSFDKTNQDKISSTAKFEQDLGLDSLDVVEAVFFIEEEFGIEIPDREADEITSVDKAVEYILAQPDGK